MESEAALRKIKYGKEGGKYQVKSRRWNNCERTDTSLNKEGSK